MREAVRAAIAAVLDSTAGLSAKRRQQLADDLADAVCGRLFDMELLAATVRAIDQARADRVVTAAHEGVVTALLQLARRIDLAEPYFEELADYNAERKMRPPSPDNVSIPTYLKYSEALGLTPGGGKAPGPAKGGRSGGGVSARRAAEQARQRRRRV